MNCYVCDTQLTKENETKEHIILNSIGGKLKSNKLICISCNSKLGSSIDDKLSHQLKPIANLLDIKRDRGYPQNIKGKYKDREVILEPGGKIRMASPLIEKGEKIIHIQASTINEATQVLKGLKRKHKDLNIEEALTNSTSKKEYLESVKIDMNFGGIDIKRAICKMAVNFFIYHGGDPTLIKYLLPFIEGKEDSKSTQYFYPRREVFYKEATDILHSLILVGDPKLRKLFVFVELFNEFKFIVFLDQDYNGRELYESYHYNTVTNEIINFDSPMTIEPKDLKKNCSNNIDDSKFLARMRLLFQKIDKVTVNNRINNITQNAIDEMLIKYPTDQYPTFTEEMLNLLSQTIAEEYVSSFQHRLLKD